MDRLASEVSSSAMVASLDELNTTGDRQRKRCCSSNSYSGEESGCKRSYVLPNADQFARCSLNHRLNVSSALQSDVSSSCVFDKDDQQSEHDVSTQSDGHDLMISRRSSACHIAHRCSLRALNINDLPMSILLRIFGYLTMFEREHRAALVCSAWLHLSRDSELWRTVVLRGQKKVTDDVLGRVVHYSNNVVSLDISGCPKVTDEGLSLALDACPSLRILKLMGCDRLSGFGVIGNCVRETLQELDLSSCLLVTDEQLIAISSSCHHLTHLVLHQCTRLTDVGVSAAVHSCPNLQTLSLDECKKLTDNVLQDIITCCPQLKSLSCRECSFTCNGISLCAQLPCLKMLDVSSIRSLSDQTVCTVADGCKLLTSFNLSLCERVSDIAVDYIAKRLKHLTSLYLVSCKITHQAVVSLSTHCKTLEVLDIGYCRVTDESAILISSSCPQLRFLGLIRCDLVTNATVIMLTERHPHIEYSTVLLEYSRLIRRAQAEGYQVPSTLLQASAFYNGT